MSPTAHQHHEGDGGGGGGDVEQHRGEPVGKDLGSAAGLLGLGHETLDSGQGGVGTDRVDLHPDGGVRGDRAGDHPVTDHAGDRS